MTIVTSHSSNFHECAAEWYLFWEKKDQTVLAHFFGEKWSQYGFVKNCENEYMRRRMWEIRNIFSRKMKEKSGKELEKRLQRAQSELDLDKIKKSVGPLSRDEALNCLRNLSPCDCTNEQLCGLLAFRDEVFDDLDSKDLEKPVNADWQIPHLNTWQKFDPAYLREKMITVLLSSFNKAKGLSFKKEDIRPDLDFWKRRGDYCQGVANSVCERVERAFQKSDLPPIDVGAVAQELFMIFGKMGAWKRDEVVSLFINSALRFRGTGSSREEEIARLKKDLDRKDPQFYTPVIEDLKKMDPNSEEWIKTFVLAQLVARNFGTTLSDCVLINKAIRNPTNSL